MKKKGDRSSEWKQPRTFTIAPSLLERIDSEVVRRAKAREADPEDEEVLGLSRSAVVNDALEEYLP